MQILIFFVGSKPNQTSLDILERFDQRSVQLDQSFRTVLTKYQEHGSHVVVVLELHVSELDAYI